MSSEKPPSAAQPGAQRQRVDDPRSGDEKAVSSFPWRSLPPHLVRIMIETLGVRQTLSQGLPCVCNEFRALSAELYFNEEF